MNVRSDRRFLLPLAFATFLLVAAWVQPRPLVTDPSPESPTEIERIYAAFDTLRTDLSAYRWPLPQGYETTSIFGDFRSTHFHGGIDVSTRGQEGVPVTAMRDGWVSQVRVSPHGYGNVVEVTHEDGFTTWYAHLRNFAPDLDSLIRIQWSNVGTVTSTLQLEPDVRPVRRGDVIAFTGQTGAGGPHLHFEIRDADGNPVDPLLAKDVGRHASDELAPVFEELGAVPLDAGTVIQGDGRPWYTRPKGTRNASVGPTINVAGRAGLTIRIRDGVGSRGYRNRNASLELLVDGVLLYSSHVSRVPSDESKQIALHYDWAGRSYGHPYHQKLFVDHGNRLPFYGRLPHGAGMLQTRELGAGLHEVEVVARDLNGNTSRLRAVIACEDPSLPTQHDLNSGRKFAVADSRVTFEPEFYRGHVYLRLRSPRSMAMLPRVRILAEGEIAEPGVRRLNSRQFYTTFPLSPELGRSLSINVTSDDPSMTLADPREIAFTPVTRDAGGFAALPDGSFKVSFPPSAVFTDLFVRLEEHSDAVRVMPGDVLLDEGARVEMRIPDELASRRAGLFFTSDGDLHLLDWHEPFGAMRLEGHVNRFLGTFEILEDETPPTLERRFLRYRSSTLQAEFRIRDRRAGVSSSTIRATVDGKPLAATYDPERHLISITERISLDRGSHRFELSARDRMANEVVWKGNFVKK